MKEFKSPQAFALHLKKLAAKHPILMTAGLVRASKLIQKDAKDEIGHLQPKVGPFAAWEELSDWTKIDKERLGYKFNSEYNPLLRTGELRDSYEYEVKGFEAIIGSKLDKAAWQEFGTPHAKHPIPERPVLGPAAFKNKRNIQMILGEQVMINFEMISFGKEKHIPYFA